MDIEIAPFATARILDVKNGQTRDLLRGLLDRQSTSNVRATFSKLMDGVSAHDLPVVDQLIRGHSLFSHLAIPSEFPPNAELFFSSRTLPTIPRPGLIPDHVIYRANANKDKVLSLLEALDRVTESIFIHNDDDVFLELVDTVDKYGYSLSLARKLAFVLGHYEKNFESWKLAASEFSRFGLDKSNYGMMAVADSIGFEFPYLDICSGFAGFADIGAKSTNSQRLSYLSFNPLCLDRDVALEALAVSYSFSLIDSVYFLLCHRDLGVIGKQYRFDDEIEAAWQRITTSDYAFSLFFDSSSSHCDVQAFRASPAFIEYKTFRGFRAATQRLYRPVDKHDSRDSSGNVFEEEFYRPAKTIRDLLPTGIAVFEPIPMSFEQDTAGSLARSCGLARLAESDPDFAGIDSQEMGDLMGSTLDMDRLLSTAALRKSAKSANDEFVELILHTLVRSHSPSTMDAYQFKRAFQAYVTSHCDANIVTFLRRTCEINAHIVEYYVSILDETILSQMPFLVKTAERVYETKAEILEWQAKRTGASAWNEKAKELRIDRKIAAVRGQINETRLNIDGVRFRQWMESTKLAEFSGFIRQEAMALPTITDFKAKKSISELHLIAHRDPNARASVAIMDSYREFCINADFGIASYLGRRIRHGTLRGTLLDGLPDPAEHALSGSAREQFEQWLETYRSFIASLNLKLHFSGRGSSNSSQISPEVDKKEKWDVLAVCLRSIHEKSQVDHGALFIPAIAEQYCWYIFEIELRDVQSTITASRAEVPTFKLRHGNIDAAMLTFERAVNLAVSSRLSVVASWFKKPPNISPVAELSDIIKVVLAEARAEYPSFHPDPHPQVLDVELSGGVYYHLYDALSVVVRNAAKHGGSPGRLSVRSYIEERATSRVMRVEVSSWVKAGDTAGAAVNRMREAGLAGAINADVIEGLSGVRKLHKMSQDKTLLNFELAESEEDEREVRVTLWLLLSGIGE